MPSRPLILHRRVDEMRVCMTCCHDRWHCAGALKFVDVPFLIIATNCTTGVRKALFCLIWFGNMRMVIDEISYWYWLRIPLTAALIATFGREIANEYDEKYIEQSCLYTNKFASYIAESPKGLLHEMSILWDWQLEIVMWNRCRVVYVASCECVNWDCVWAIDTGLISTGVYLPGVAEYRKMLQLVCWQLVRWQPRYTRSFEVTIWVNTSVKMLGVDVWGFCAFDGMIERWRVSYSWFTSEMWKVTGLVYFMLRGGKVEVNVGLRLSLEATLWRDGCWLHYGDETISIRDMIYYGWTRATVPKGRLVATW